MTNHKTRDFLTSLPAAETWITPGWCRNEQPVDRGCMEAMGCGTRANCDVSYVDLTRVWCECLKTSVEPGEPPLECPRCKTTTEWANLTG